MHWTAGQLAGLLRHPFVPDCIPLYHRISFNLFLNYFKLYLIVNNDKLRMAPRCLFCFTQTCPVYRLLTVTVEYEPSLQVFIFLIFLQAFLCYVGLPVLMIIFFVIPFRPHVMVCEMFDYYRDAATVTQTSLPF